MVARLSGSQYHDVFLNSFLGFNGNDLSHGPLGLDFRLYQNLALGRLQLNPACRSCGGLQYNETTSVLCFPRYVEDVALFMLPDLL